MLIILAFYAVLYEGNVYNARSICQNEKKQSAAMTRSLCIFAAIIATMNAATVVIVIVVVITRKTVYLVSITVRIIARPATEAIHTWQK